MSEDVQSPAKWVEILAERGIEISERTLRSKARKYGQFYAVGQKMILHPWHIQAIFKMEAEAQMHSGETHRKGKQK